MTSSLDPTKAYPHIRVLDMSRVLAGPLAGQLMADLGAEVIKIERPGAGDDTRHIGPPFIKDADGNPTTEAAYYLCVNRGKKSITVDISNPQGQQVIRDLAAHADVLIENYKVGDLARYGLAYQDLKAVNPRLIYCSITGFGQTGPYREKVGYDFLIQAAGGLMSLTGHGDGQPGGGPMKVGVPVTDVVTGLYAVVAIQAALARRERCGTGENIDLALLDCNVAMLTNQGQNFLSGDGSVSPRMGNTHPNVAPNDVYATADGHLVLSIGSDLQYRRFCAAVGRPDLSEDARYVSNPQRMVNMARLTHEVAAILAAGTTRHWEDRFGPAGVPVGPINTLAQVFKHPQVLERGMLFEMDHPLGGKVPLTANPIHFTEAPIRYGLPPPLLGQHTRDVLGDVLGLDEAQIDSLVAQGAL